MKEYPIVGMSPGNSYFNDEVIKELLKTVVDQFGETAVLIADVPAIATYIALGYSENRARNEKAIPKGRNLKNKVIRAKTELGYSDEQVKMIDWEHDVENHPDYQNKYTELKDLYQSNAAFQKAANDATREVLENSGKDIEDLSSAVKIGVHYLLAEFAFMEFAPSYLAADAVTYVYHRNWPVYDAYRKGEFDGRPRPYLGATVITTSAD